MAGHSVDEYLETIYFLAFPIGEYKPLTGGTSPTLASRVAEMLGVSRASAGVGRVLAITSVDNDPSIRLLGKLGFRFERMVRLGEDTTELRLFASEP